MKNVRSVEEVLSQWNDWQLVDVRSPGEFTTGHIPGAFSLPLFTDEERARVGTLYKQVSPGAAMQEGLAIVGPKMNDIVAQASMMEKETEKQILLYCWRGGKRSEAIQWLLNFSGMKVQRLAGGYKSFRQAAHAFFDQIPFELNLLGGGTGSGKTEILKEIANLGYQVIDLEKLANHKGSAFGSIGEASQPSNEQFENNLFLAFLSLDTTKPVWLENESKSIGRVFLPEGLWQRMKEATLYNINVDRELRIDRALAYYSTPVDLERLKASFFNIRKRLGGLEYQKAIDALNSGDLRAAASIALHYYDKSYSYQLSQLVSGKVIHLQECNDIAETVERLLMEANKFTYNTVN